MIRSTTAVAAALICATPALAGFANEASYGWEDGGTVMGWYNSGSGVPQFLNTDAQAYEGSRSLEIIEDPTGGTPQIWVGFITGLTDGDTIDASFFAFDDSEGASPSVRIWGGYAMSDDISNYMGSAGGNSDFSDGSGWSELSHTWTFDSDVGGSNEGRNALVIQVRLYADSEQTPVYIDDLRIATSSDTAEISFAPTPGALALLGVAGLAGRRRRA